MQIAKYHKFGHCITKKAKCIPQCIYFSFLPIPKCIRFTIFLLFGINLIPYLEILTSIHKVHDDCETDEGRASKKLLLSGSITKM